MEARQQEHIPTNTTENVSGVRGWKTAILISRGGRFRGALRGSVVRLSVGTREENAGLQDAPTVVFGNGRLNICDTSRLFSYLFIGFNNYIYIYTSKC